jgi:predicted O-methyltransferase YrrM
MNAKLNALLTKLEQFGAENDSVKEVKSEKMLNITRDTGEFLRAMIVAANAKNIVEAGTSNGYSTIWLALGAEAVGGQVTTIELLDEKVKMAAENFAESGMGGFITQIQQDAGFYFASLKDASVDMVFLDSKRTEYAGWWGDIIRCLVPGGFIVVDNALSHVEELADFTETVNACDGVITSLLPLGKGELVIVKNR